jgi:hypothetical protein
MGDISDEISRYQRRRSTLRLMDEEAELFPRRLIERRRML